MNRILKTVLFLIIAVIIIGLILYPKLKPDEKGPAMASPRGSSVVPVEAKIIHPQRIDNVIKITGAIIANESVALKSEISGKVEGIYFQEGQKVKKHDPDSRNLDPEAAFI